MSNSVSIFILHIYTVMLWLWRCAMKPQTNLTFCLTKCATMVTRDRPILPLSLNLVNMKSDLVHKTQYLPSTIILLLISFNNSLPTLKAFIDKYVFKN